MNLRFNPALFYRLTDAVDFELNQEIPLLQKIGSMYDLFHRKYASVWQITFEDVLRLTTKQDVADMTVQEWKALAANVNGAAIHNLSSYLL